MCTSCCPFVQFACQCCNLTWPHTVTYSWPQLPPTDSLFLCSNLLKWLMHIFFKLDKVTFVFLHWAFEKRSRDITAVKRCSHLPRDVTTRPLVSATCAAAGELHRPQFAPGEGRTYTPSAAANQLTLSSMTRWVNDFLFWELLCPCRFNIQFFKMNTHCLKCLQHS